MNVIVKMLRDSRTVIGAWSDGVLWLFKIEKLSAQISNRLWVLINIVAKSLFVDRLVRWMLVFNNFEQIFSVSACLRSAFLILVALFTYRFMEKIKLKK